MNKMNPQLQRQIKAIKRQRRKENLDILVTFTGYIVAWGIILWIYAQLY